MKNQPAIPNGVSSALPLHRQNPWLCSYMRGDVLQGRSALRIYPPVRRHPRIPLSPQLAIDGGLAHSAMPKDEAIGLQGLQNGQQRHADIVSAAARTDLAHDEPAHAAHDRRAVRVGTSCGVTGHQAGQGHLPETIMVSVSGSRYGYRSAVSPEVDAGPVGSPGGADRSAEERGQSPDSGRALVDRLGWGEATRPVLLGELGAGEGK